RTIEELAVFVLTAGIIAHSKQSSSLKISLLRLTVYITRTPKPCKAPGLIRSSASLLPAKWMNLIGFSLEPLGHFAALLEHRIDKPVFHRLLAAHEVVTVQVAV